MTSIGNDIIALKTIDISRTRSPRFYSKILSLTEQQLYQAQLPGLPFDLFVWLLWSVKESAYKCLQRHQPDLVFSPVNTEVIQLGPPSAPSNKLTPIITATGFNSTACFCSSIRLNALTLYARTIIYGNELIVSVVQEIPDFNEVQWGVKQIAGTDPASQSAAVRDFLFERFYPLYPGRKLSISKNDSGCPSLFADGIVMDIPVSLSHHDEYVGYAFR